MLVRSPNSVVTKCADEWFTPLRFGGILLLLIFAAFPEVVLGRGTFFHRDFSLFGYPLAYYHREAFWRGEIPLWNPLNSCGLPFLAQWNTLTLYPLSLIYLLMPLSYSLGLFCLLHLFLAGMGMYVLAHSWTNNRFAASVSGIAFVFSALMLNFLMWPNNMAAAGWMPWVVLAADRAMDEGGRRLVPAVLVGAMQMLSGAPEVILLTWVFIGSLTLLSPSLSISALLVRVRRLLVVGLLGASLAAAQLLPFLDLLAASQRDRNFSDAEWAMPAYGWANFLVPLFRAFPTGLGVFAQLNQYWVYSYYLGIGSFTFALLGLLSVRQPLSRLLGAVTLICLVLALGKAGWLYPALRSVAPALGFMRFPIKFVVLPAFCIPLLAGMYVAHLQQDADTWLTRQRRKALVVFGLILLAIAAILFAAHGISTPQIPWSVAGWNGLIRVSFLAGSLGLLLLPRHNTPFRTRLLLRLGLLSFFWLDVMMMGGSRPNPVVSQDVYEPDLIRQQAAFDPAPLAGESRVMMRIQTLEAVNKVQFSTPAEVVLYERLALFGNVNLLDHYAKVGGFYSLYLRDVQTISPLLAIDPIPEGLMDFLAVSHLNVPGKATEWIHRKTHLPWVSSGQTPVFSSDQITLKGLGDPGFDPHKTVFLPEDTLGGVVATNGYQATIGRPTFSSQRVSFQADAAEPALVIISQAFYKPWRATVDGKLTPLLRANFAFQALEISPGSHKVEMVYIDRSFRAGAAISSLALAVVFGIWLRFRRTASQNSPPV